VRRHGLVATFHFDDEAGVADLGVHAVGVKVDVRAVGDGHPDAVASTRTTG
jgi:hypothetical protein